MTPRGLVLACVLALACGSGGSGPDGGGQDGEPDATDRGTGQGGAGGNVGAAGCAPVSDNFYTFCADGVATTRVVCPPSESTFKCPYGCERSTGFGAPNVCYQQPPPDAAIDGAADATSGDAVLDGAVTDGTADARF